MTRQEQKLTAYRTKLKLERWLVSQLRPWMREMAAHYRLGQYTVNQNTADDLRSILRRFYQKAQNEILKIDTRHYKAESSDWYQSFIRSLVTQLDKVVYKHWQGSSSEILRTAGKVMSRVSNIAQENGWSEREARQAVVNHMRNNVLTIATTESQFITETTRATAVIMVPDPLKDSVIQVSELIRNGDRNAAVRLSREVMRLARMPLSVAQGELVQMVSDVGRRDLLTPLVQGEYLANLELRAESLGKTEKIWEAIGDDKTRESHLEADGQVVGVEEPFQLEGGLLMWPGDAALGADLSEIINCRCSASYLD